MRAVTAPGGITMSLTGCLMIRTCTDGDENPLETHKRVRSTLFKRQEHEECKGVGKPA